MSYNKAAGAQGDEGGDDVEEAASDVEGEEESTDMVADALDEWPALTASRHLAAG